MRKTESACIDQYCILSFNRLQESELKEALAIKKAEQESWEKEHKEISGLL